MPTLLKLQFREAREPVTQAVTKFGGQPVWLERPAQPLSRRTGEPMTFVGQVLVPRDWYGGQDLRIAYLFMTGAGFDHRAMETWDPAEGETAVVVQSGTAVAAGAGAPYPDVLKRWDETGGKRSEVPCEYEVLAEPAEEPGYMSQADTDALDDAARNDIVERWRGNKVGGSPYWLQGEQLPYPGWRLLLQLEDGTYPFNLNLGTGAGYVFLNANCTEGQLLWQC